MCLHINKCRQLFLCKQCMMQFYICLVLFCAIYFLTYQHDTNISSSISSFRFCMEMWVLQIFVSPLQAGTSSLSSLSHSLIRLEGRSSLTVEKRFKHAQSLLQPTWICTSAQKLPRMRQADAFLYTEAYTARTRITKRSGNTLSHSTTQTHTPTVWHRQFEGPHFCLSLPVCSVWPSLFICLIK